MPGPVGQGTDNGALLIRDGLITAVGSAADITTQAGPSAERKDFPNATALPGLIDAHAHLVLDAGPDTLTRLSTQTDDEQLLDDMRTRASHALGSGVTTLRDVGDTRGLTARLRDPGRTHLPRLLTAGSPITVPGGDAAFLGGETDYADLQKEVKARVAAGADFISVIASGGHLGPSGPPFYESVFTTDQLRAMADEAHDAGVRITVHAHAAEAVRSAVQARVDGIEHATWASGDKQVTYDPDTVATIAKQRIAVCVPQSFNWRRVVAAMGAERAFQNFYGKLRWFDQAGVRQIVGSRAGTNNAPFNGLAAALESYQWAGVPAEQIVAAATSDAATALGIERLTGTLTPGLAADVLIVDGDPATNIAALHKVVGIYKDGVSV